MLTTLSSSHTSELGAKSVHGWKVMPHRTRPQSSERQDAAALRLPAHQLSEQRQNPKSVMVCARRPLVVFVDEGLKIHQNAYHSETLGSVATLVDSNGNFNTIMLQPSERKRHRSGASPLFSRLHHICGMAALLAWSQPCGLQHLVNFRGHGLC